MSSRLRISFGVIFLGLIVAIVLPLINEVGRVTAAKAKRIHRGMTRAEAEAILGLPDRTEVSIPELWIGLAAAPCAVYESNNVLTGRESRIQVWYDWGDGPPGVDKNSQTIDPNGAEPRPGQRVILCEFRETASVDPLLARLGIIPRVRE